MTSEKLKPTPGPWLFGDWSNNKPGEVDEAGWVDVWARLPDGTRSLPVVSCKHQQEIENARLIAEAGTVHHECGLSPRELLERCSAMEAALNACKDALEWVVEQGGGPVCEHEGGVVCFCKENNAINAARAALAKHKEV